MNLTVEKKGNFKDNKLKIGAVSYLNTKPLIYGFEQGLMKDDIDLIIDYPSKIAEKLLNNQIDIGLVPVAIIPQMKAYKIISNYCIASNGMVASVSVFSDVPINKITTILLDYQSKTSVALLKILLKEYWKINPEIIETKEGYETKIGGNIAGLVIGDRALKIVNKYKYNYDLSFAWQSLTQLPFVFAAWVCNKNLDEKFIKKFNEANNLGLNNIHLFYNHPINKFYSLQNYFNQNIKYHFGENEKQGLKVFLNYLNCNLQT